MRYVMLSRTNTIYISFRFDHQSIKNTKVQAWGRDTRVCVCCVDGQRLRLSYSYTLFSKKTKHNYVGTGPLCPNKEGWVCDYHRYRVERVKKMRRWPFFVLYYHTDIYMLPYSLTRLRPHYFVYILTYCCRALYVLYFLTNGSRSYPSKTDYQ